MINMQIFKNKNEAIARLLEKNSEVTSKTCVAIEKSNGTLPKALLNPKPKRVRQLALDFQAENI